jgi:type I restriction enzyme S subunit
VSRAENTVRSPWQPCDAMGWNQLQIKRRFAIELGKMLQNGPFSSVDTEVPYLKAQHVQWDGVRLADLPTMWASPNDIKALQIHSGDLLVCEGGEVGRGAIVQSEPPDDCIIQNALHRVRGHAAGDHRFLYYILRHAATQSWFDVLCNRSTIAHFTGDKFGEMWVWLPSVNHQCSIADFLDRETAKIDALIAAKERLLGISSEKRRALIAHAITRGLNPDVPYRDSGIPWLGTIPAHWKTERAKWLFHERDERSETGDEELLTVSHLTGVTPRSEKNVNMFEAETTEGYKLCCAGDLVINTLWAWMGAMGVSPVDGIASPAYNVYTPNMSLDPAYVDALVRIPVFAEEATRFSKGVWSSRLRLYPEGFFEIWMPVPPVEEQRAIVVHIKRETAKLDAMRAAAEKTIGLLKERRAALIAATVTGVMNISEQ